MIPVEADVLNLRDALWQLGEAAKDYLERPTEERRARLQRMLTVAEKARDDSHAHEQARERERRARKLDGERAPEYVTKVA
jgi:hypothetical protein